MKRTVSIQDISCFGRCSLTVALPTLSAMGIETAILPTAILSTHTSGFQGFTFCDLSDEMDKIASHWEKEGISFDSIGTGYLGSDEQIHTVLHFFETFGQSALRFVDPVMADHGKLYPAFDESFPAKMARLCEAADVIVPNLTEAAFLLGEKFVGDDYDEAYIHALLRRLASRFRCRVVIVTGVVYTPDKQGAVAYLPENDSFYEYFSENIPRRFHGTGDVFSSSLCGALTLGMNLAEALKTAVDFTVASIRATLGKEEYYWYGVNFEDCLGTLAEATRPYRQ